MHWSVARIAVAVLAVRAFAAGAQVPQQEQQVLRQPCLRDACDCSIDTVPVNGVCYPWQLLDPDLCFPDCAIEYRGAFRAEDQTDDTHDWAEWLLGGAEGTLVQNHTVIPGSTYAVTSKVVRAQPGASLRLVVSSPVGDLFDSGVRPVRAGDTFKGEFCSQAAGTFTSTVTALTGEGGLEDESFAFKFLLWSLPGPGDCA